MLGCFWTSIFRPVFFGPASDDTCFTSSSAPIFWHLGICVNSTWLKSYVKSLVNLRHFCIISSFTSNFPFIWPTTSFELLWRSKFLTPNAFPTLSPVSTPKLMMWKSSAIQVRLDEAGTSCCNYGCGEKPSSGGHWCGACHRVSNDKVSI